MELINELVEKILAELEKRTPQDANKAFPIAGYSDAEVSYHVMLMAEGGLIKAVDFSHQQGHSWKPVSLTLKGHELLNDFREAAKAPEGKKNRIGFVDS